MKSKTKTMKEVDILLTEHKYNYDKDTKTFTISERGIPFSMNYKVINPNTGGSRSFELSHSTGSEYDPDTIWIYKSGEFTLEIVQDKFLTKIRSDNYLRHKTKDYR